MSTVKDDIRTLLLKLPDDCTLEDIQYHVYVLEKVRKGIAVAGERGVVSQQEAEQRLSKWVSG